MKKRTKITLWSILFVIVFTVSALIRVNLLGSAPMRLMQVKWDDTVGTIYNDLNYENDYGHKYDLYVPANLDIGNAQQLILFIHGGSFNSGAKDWPSGLQHHLHFKGHPFRKIVVRTPQPSTKDPCTLLKIIALVLSHINVSFQKRQIFLFFLRGE